jgi:large subunit ribosomal protein L9
MKVILKEEVRSLGHIGDIIDVSNGYARNYLLPKKLAVEANTKNVKEFEHNKGILLKKAARIKEASQTLADKLMTASLNIRAKAGEDGKLFGSVTNMDIAEALKVEGFEIDKKKISIDEPIKRIGIYSVSVKIHPEVNTQVKVNVVSDSLEAQT